MTWVDVVHTQAQELEGFSWSSYYSCMHGHVCLRLVTTAPPSYLGGAVTNLSSY